MTSEDVIVDVGSGVGAISLVLAKEVPDARIILQDTSPVLEHAQKVWSRLSLPASRTINDTVVC